MKRRVKVNGIIIFVLLLGIAAFPGLFFRTEKEAYLSNELLEVIGIASILLGQLLRVSARGYKSEHSQGGHTLVQGGPYSVVRNPMYLGIFLIGIGIVMMLFNWWVAILLSALFGVQYVGLIFKEEKKLRLLFHGAYEQYCNKVPRRLLPPLRAIMNLDVADYLPLKLKWVKQESISICLLLFFVLLIESWTDIKQEGFSFYLRESRMIPGILILFILLVFWLNKRTESMLTNGTYKSAPPKQ